jgi:CO/xanthine dehydrogenase Mo-binding subunit
MTTEAVRLVGPGVDRVDGPLKVTGTAAYPGDFGFAASRPRPLRRLRAYSPLSPISMPRT